MRTSIQRRFLLTLGLLFCVLGCTRDRGHILMPDDVSAPMDAHESVDVVEASFQHNLLPILTTKCALAGCHVADGPHGLDFRTYESFIAGGEHGPAFIPGNAKESEVVEQIVEGKMPPPESGLPKVPDDEIQIFINWINQQEPQGDIVPHDDAHDEAEDEQVDIDDAHDDDDDDDDDDHDDHDDDDDDDNHNDHDDDD